MNVWSSPDHVPINAKTHQEVIDVIARLDKNYWLTRSHVLVRYPIIMLHDPCTSLCLLVSHDLWCILLTFCYGFIVYIIPSFKNHGVKNFRSSYHLQSNLIFPLLTHFFLFNSYVCFNCKSVFDKTMLTHFHIWQRHCKSSTNLENLK